MNTRLFLQILLLVLPVKSLWAQIFCDTTGNVIIYSNYEGGYLNINVDENIPNLKVGICTYEAVEVNFSGTYAGNITEVIYAGFGNTNNSQCGPNIPNVVINGVSSTIVTIYSTTTGNIALTTYLGDIFPYINIPLINCMTSGEGCISSTNQGGGGNSSPQIVDFFLTEFGAGSLLYYHWTDYNCFFSTTYNVSDGGNCCLQTPTGQPNPIYQGGSNYNFLPSDTMLCSDSIILDVSFYPVLYQPVAYTGYVWSTGDTGATLIVTQPGVYSFYVSDYCHGSWSYYLTDTITVLPCCSLEATLSTTNVACNGGTDGSAFVTIISGVTDTIMWNTQPVVFGDSIFNLPADSSSVTLIDTAGCDTTMSFFITEPPPLIAVITGSDSLCLSSSAELAGSATGGTNPYTFLWNTGSTNDTISVSPVQSSTYTVTVTDSNLCSSDTTFELTVVEAPVAAFDPPLAGCEDFEAVFQNQSVNATSFYWDFGDTISTEADPVHIYTDAGTFDVTLIASAYGCADTLLQSDFVTVYPLPVPSFELDYLAGSDELTFINTSVGLDSCVVDFGDGTVLSGCPPEEIIHFYTTEGEYTITLYAFSEEGCMDTSVKTIEIIFADPVLFPNAFTPNGDGFNDFFEPIISTEISSYRLVMFNRWGQKIFDTTDPEAGWDGTFQSQKEEMGAYTWWSTFNIPDDQQSVTLKGSVILLR